MEKSRNLKQSIIELLDQRKMDCSVQGYLGLLKIMNVYVENIKE